MADTPDRIYRANSPAEHGVAAWGADYLEKIGGVSEAHVKYVREDVAEAEKQLAVAAALKEAAGICTGDENRPEKISGAKLRRMSVAEQFAYEQKRLAWRDADAILALIDHDAGSALDRALAAERERLVILCQIEIDRGDRNGQTSYAAGARACRDAIRAQGET